MIWEYLAQYNEEEDVSPNIIAVCTCANASNVTSNTISLVSVTRLNVTPTQIRHRRVGFTDNFIATPAKRGRPRAGGERASIASIKD